MRDIVIVGGGHNALVAAFYLARAGRKPLVLERRAMAGGAAVTEEFHPGFRCSTLAHAAGPLRPEIVRDMQLERHGLEMVFPDPRLFAPAPDGRALLLYEDTARTTRQIAAFSTKDAAAYLKFQQVLERLGGFLAKLLGATPPEIENPTPGDLWGLLHTGRDLRKLGDKDLYRLLRWMPMAVADLVAEFFETELLRAMIAARGIFGSFAGPWSAGSGALLLLRAAGDPHPAGPACFARGGMGALTQAMAAAAKQAGAEIRTGAEVTQVLVKDGVATGVALANGEEIVAQKVVSSADPRRTFLSLVDPVHLTPSFILRMESYRAPGVTAKVNLALGGLPTFTALADLGDGGRGMVAGRIHIGPQIDYLERAFDAAKYGDFSPEPYLDVMIPTLSDPSLAPAGKHVMSVYMQFAPYKLKNGDWNGRREELGRVVLETLERYAPGLASLVLGGEVITPLDLEQTYGLTGGHIFHGDLALDQIFTMRPLLGWARYRTPIRGLYLCGSGTHPGTGLTGGSGANAAREILKDLRK